MRLLASFNIFIGLQFAHMRSGAPLDMNLIVLLIC